MKKNARSLSNVPQTTNANLHLNNQASYNPHYQQQANKQQNPVFSNVRSAPPPMPGHQRSISDMNYNAC